jgi:hypothetical protein
MQTKQTYDALKQIDLGLRVSALVRKGLAADILVMEKVRMSHASRLAHALPSTPPTPPPRFLSFSCSQPPPVVECDMSRAALGVP